MKSVRWVQGLGRLFLVALFLLAVLATHLFVVKHYYDTRIASGNIRFWTDDEGFEWSSWSVFTLLAYSLLLWPAFAAMAIVYGLQARVPGPRANRSLRGRKAGSSRSSAPTETGTPKKPTQADFPRDLRDDDPG
jgi:hypothetical protein